MISQHFRTAAEPPEALVNNSPHVCPSSDGPLISIVMPAFNVESFIAEAIESVRSQTFSAWELLVVNDGSSDNTETVARSWAARDQRIRVFSQANRGQGHARNTALAQCRGRLIAFLDADDLWPPEKLAVQLAVLKRENVDVVFSGGSAFESQSYQPDNQPFGSTLTGRIAPAEAWRLQRSAARIPMCTFLGKTHVIVELGGFDEAPSIRGSEDYDLVCRLARHGCTFFGLPDALYRYRRYSTQTSASRLGMLRSELAVVEKNWGAVERTDPIARLRIANLRRALIREYLGLGDLKEARRLLGLIRRADPWRPGLYLQTALLLLAPRLFAAWTARRELRTA